MALSVWQKFVTDGSGNPISGASVEVRDPGTTTKNAIYKDRAGTTQWASNVATTDADGFVQLYVAAGRYDIFVDDGAGHTATYEDVYIGSAIMLRDVGKTIGDIPEYEDDGAGNPVLDHPNAPRVNGEAIRPEWILVEEVVLNGEGLDHTFSGLDGDVDRKYKLTFDGEIPAGGASYPSERSILVQPFSDSTAGNYHTLKHRFYHAGGGSLSHGLDLNNGDISGLQLTRSDWASVGKVTCEMIVEVEQGNGGRVSRGESCFIPNDYGDRSLHMLDDSRYDGNTATNLTDVRVFWGNGTGEALTGVLRLFKPGF